VQHAKPLDPIAFLCLTDQVVGRWIDHDAEDNGRLKWKDSVLKKVMHLVVSQ